MTEAETDRRKKLAYEHFKRQAPDKVAMGWAELVQKYQQYISEAHAARRAGAPTKVLSQLRKALRPARWISDGESYRDRIPQTLDAISIAAQAVTPPKLEIAELACREFLEHYERLHLFGEDRIGIAMVRLAQIPEKKNNLANAERLFERARKTLARAHGEESARLLPALKGLHRLKKEKDTVATKALADQMVRIKRKAQRQLVPKDGDVFLNIPDLDRTRRRFKEGPYGALLDTSWGQNLKPKAVDLLQYLIGADLERVLPWVKRAAVGVAAVADPDRPEGHLLGPYVSILTDPKAPLLDNFLKKAFFLGPAFLMDMHPVTEEASRIMLPKYLERALTKQKQDARWKVHLSKSDADLSATMPASEEYQELLKMFSGVIGIGSAVKGFSVRMKLTPNGLQESRSITFSKNGPPAWGKVLPQLDLKRFHAVPAEAHWAFAFQGDPAFTSLWLKYGNTGIWSLIFKNFDPLLERHGLKSTKALLSSLKGTTLLYGGLQGDHFSGALQADLPAGLGSKVLKLLIQEVGLKEGTGKQWERRFSNEVTLRGSYEKGRLKVALISPTAQAADLNAPVFWKAPKVQKTLRMIPHAKQDHLLYCGISRSSAWWPDVANVVLREVMAHGNAAITEDLRRLVITDLQRSLKGGYIYEVVRKDGYDFRAEGILGGPTTVSSLLLLGSTLIVPKGQTNRSLFDRISKGELFKSD